VSPVEMERGKGGGSSGVSDAAIRALAGERRTANQGRLRRPWSSRRLREASTAPPAEMERGKGGGARGVSESDAAIRALAGERRTGGVQGRTIGSQRGGLSQLFTGKKGITGIFDHLPHFSLDLDNLPHFMCPLIICHTYIYSFLLCHISVSIGLFTFITTIYIKKYGTSTDCGRTFPGLDRIV
jgi:hypothetical protein